ncbi:MAG TPA: HpcH/HpaI aldolase/citrate lyase family protein [Xanthobacteraceae bacterium]|jgi:4-hydroxy-2-oxoheptanedioate aldolase|nr:HpcH/HpaI aldolase/citrate lyase family protein [Xanthobacteraceae bacterium]
MIDDLPQNKFKRALAAKQTQIGLWMSLTSPFATEVVAGAGFDWILLDMEHSANDLPEIVHHLRAAQGGTAEPIVRVPWNEPVMVKRVLDVGAQSLLFPFVQSADEARRAVAATRYPPNGIRGVAGLTRATRYGRIPDYFKRAEAEISVIVQVETRKAVAAIEEIAAVEGIDGIFIGPADLSADHGHPNNWQRPEIWSAIIEAGQRIQKAGKSAGFLSAREDDCRKVLAAGFGFVAVGSDTGVLARQSEALVKMYKS